MRALNRSALLALLLLLGDPSGDGYGTPADSEISGDYRRVGPAIVVLNVSVGDGGVRVELEGGGPPASNGSVPADCIVRATDNLKGRLLSAVFEPIETEEFSYSSAEARVEKRHLVIAFTPGMAEVKRADTEGYCGLGIEFQGLYRKTR
jgi:hypothetical protein